LIFPCNDFVSSFLGIQIDRKCAGEPIDETLVNGALSFYSEIGESTRNNDPKHFAETMMKENAACCNMSRLQI
jgi:hypothetical protein